MGHPPLKNTNISLRVFLIWPTGRWPPSSFPLLVPTPLLGFLLLKHPDRHSADGSYPHSESTYPICRWVTPPLQIPTKFSAPLMGFSQLRINCESNFAARIFPLGGPNYHSVMVLPPLGVSASILSMGHTLTSEPYQVCMYHWWDYPHSVQHPGLPKYSKPIDATGDTD